MERLWDRSGERGWVREANCERRRCVVWERQVACGGEESCAGEEKVEGGMDSEVDVGREVVGRGGQSGVLMVVAEGEKKSSRSMGRAEGDKGGRRWEEGVVVVVVAVAGVETLEREARNRSSGEADDVEPVWKEGVVEEVSGVENIRSSRNVSLSFESELLVVPNQASKSKCSN